MLKVTQMASRMPAPLLLGCLPPQREAQRSLRP
jgi:hypothetical protein